MDSYQCVSFFLHRGIQNWTQHSSWVSPVLRGSFSSPDLLLMPLPKPGFAVRAHYWLMVTLASARTPWFFSTKLLFSLLFPNMVHRDIPPYEQSWHFLLVKMNEIPVCSFLQTFRILSEWWNNHLVYQLLLPVLCHLQVGRCHIQVQRCSLVLENITLASTAEKLGAGPYPDPNQISVGGNILLSKVSEEKKKSKQAKTKKQISFSGEGWCVWIQHGAGVQLRNAPRSCSLITDFCCNTFHIWAQSSLTFPAAAPDSVWACGMFWSGIQ